ncbi:MAG TPA: hypothetical protein VMF61_17240 [Candidatus Acidoferrales bacterium]|nr:hypothetical protein [Candidatus Acidoferrales bacterium]
MRFALVALAIALVAGCGPRDRALAPSAFALSGLLAPAGLVVPKNVEAAPNLNYDGLYLEEPDASVCCWIAPHATVFVANDRPRAHTLIAGFYVPEDIKIFTNGQTLRFRFPGSNATSTRHLGTAFQSVRVPVPSGAQQNRGPIPVTVDATVAFVPSLDLPPRFSFRSLLRFGTPPPGDDRQLAVVLLYAYFR